MKSYCYALSELVIQCLFDKDSKSIRHIPFKLLSISIQYRKDVESMFNCHPLTSVRFVNSNGVDSYLNSSSTLRNSSSIKRNANRAYDKSGNA